MTFENFLRDLLDPFNVFHKKQTGTTSPYLEQQRLNIKNYRKAYWNVVNNKIMTPTEIKRKGLYIEEAMEQGVSAMGGGSSLLDGITNVVRGINPDAPVLVSGSSADSTPIILSPTLNATIVDTTTQLNNIAIGVQTAENAAQFKIRQRKRSTQQRNERKRLASELAKLADPENPNPAEYGSMSTADIIYAIANFNVSQSHNIEQKDPSEREQKDPLEEQQAESSEALSEIENKRLEDESAYEGNERYQRVMKGERRAFNKKTSDRNTAYWGVLRELIRLSLSGSYPLITIRGDGTQGSSVIVQTALTEIGNLEGAPQRMLDFLASYGVNLRVPTARRSQDALPSARSLLQQILVLNLDTKYKLTDSFSKLFRVLLEQALAESKLTDSKRKALEKLLKNMGAEIPFQEHKSNDKTEKPINANDMVEIGNEQLLTTFRELLVEFGMNDNRINSLNSVLSNMGDDETRTQYVNIMRESPNMPPDEIRTEAIFRAQSRVLREIILGIDTMNSQLESEIDTRSNLRNAIVVFRIKSIIERLISEARDGLKIATTGGVPDLYFSFSELTKALEKTRNIFSMLTTRTTAGGIPIQTPPTPVIGQYAIDNLEIKYDDVKSEITPADEQAAIEILREFRRPPRNLVSVRIFRTRFSIAETQTVLFWNGIRTAQVRLILIDHIMNEPQPTTEAGISLNRSLLNQIRRAEGAELYRLADTLITKESEKANLLKKYSGLKPPNQPGDPPGNPPDPPSGLVVGINDNYRTLNIRVIFSILALIGATATAIAEIVKKLNRGETVDTKGTYTPPVSDPSKTIVDTPKDGPTGGTGTDTPSNNIPPNNYPTDDIPSNNLPEDQMFPNRGGNTDPIYGGIGNIVSRPQPFKPIGQPTLDTNLGADYIEADDNMLRNSAVMELVQKYNDGATRYNELIALKFDSTLSVEEVEELRDLTLSMKDQISSINQQSALVPSIGASTNSQYYRNQIQTTKMTGAFVNTSGKTIDNVYTLIPKDDFTKSIGLDDEITTYNALSAEYNSIAMKYKGYGNAYGNEWRGHGAEVAARDLYMKQQSENPEYVKALSRATEIDKQIQTLLTKINAVLINPETSVGRDVGRDVKYTDAQKSLIDKAGDINWTNISTITEQEKQALRDSPELYPDFERMMTIYNRITDNGKKPINMRSVEDPDWKELNQLRDKFTDIKKGGYKYTGEKTALPSTDWNLVQSTSQKEYVRSKQEFLDAVARMKSAKQNGASSHQVSMLYNDLETKRLHYDASRQNYEKMADSYKHSLSGRTSYLADMTKERLPDNNQEAEHFDRLQTIERVLMNNPDALKEYNDRVASLSQYPHSNESDYGMRTGFLREISTKYNLTKEFTDASTREIDVKIPNMAEDPSTIVQFEGEGAEDVGQSTERANFIDPAEATLFMSDTRQRMEEQKRWEGFSLVQPWNGLGNPQTNPLLRHQVEEYITQYAKCDKAPKPTPQQLRQLPAFKNTVIQNRGFQPNYKTDFPFIPTVQATFGREVWENEFAIPTNDFKSQKAIFSRADNDLPDNQFNTWYPSQGSVYHPDRQIDARNFDESSTPKLKTNTTRRPVFEGLSSGFVEQYQSQQVSQFGGKTMNNNFGNTPQPTQPQRRPNSVFDTLDVSARRNMSIRSYRR